VLVTLGATTRWLNPFGMLCPQVVVNLLFKLCVSVDLARHGENFRYDVELFLSRALQNRQWAFVLRAHEIAA
jgi:hypothetical protein